MTIDTDAAAPPAADLDEVSAAAAEPVGAASPAAAASTGASDAADATDPGTDSGADPGPGTAPAHAEIAVPTPLDVPGQPVLDLDRALEAVLFIADEPQSVVHLAAAVQRPVAEVRAAIARLRDDYDGVGASGESEDAADANGATAARGAGVRRAFELREVGGGWRFYVRDDYDALVAHAAPPPPPTRLSQAALETLAVIAYKQPISRPQVASIRAVNVDSVVRTLLGRGLITEVSSDPETGAILYGTTEAFLVHLGINSLDELPPVSPLLDDGQDGFDGDR